MKERVRHKTCLGDTRKENRTERLCLDHTTGYEPFYRYARTSKFGQIE